MPVIAFLRCTPGPGDFVWLAFVVVQVLDGVMSYIGVRTFGPWIEANPIVGFYAEALGPALGFTGAKLFAVGCGTVLSMMARHGTLAVLTAVYVVFAVAPWLEILAV